MKSTSLPAERTYRAVPFAALDNRRLRRNLPGRSGQQVYEVSRTWVICHVMEHDLHYGGEVSLLLGMDGCKPSNFERSRAGGNGDSVKSRKQLDPQRLRTSRLRT